MAELIRRTRPTRSQKRKRRVLRQREHTVPRRVHEKIDRLKQGPLLMRFINSRELFETLNRGEIRGSSEFLTQGKAATAVKTGLPGIIEAGKKGSWTGFAKATSDWDLGLQRIYFKELSDKLLKDARKNTKTERQALVGFQEKMMHEATKEWALSEILGLRNEFKILKDTLKDQKQFDAAVFKGDTRGINPKERENLVGAVKKFKRWFSRSELNVIKGMLFDPEFLAKNPNQISLAIRVGSKLRAQHEEFGGKEFRFGYDTLLLVGREAVPRENEFYSLNEPVSWINLNGTKAKDILGVVVLVGNPEQTVGRILTATKDKPEMRLPIYDKEGNILWPKPKK